MRFLLKKNKKRRIGADVTAINRQVIARAGDTVDAAFLQKLVESRPPVARPAILLGETRIISHLRSVLSEPKYSFLLASSAGGAHVLELLAQTHLPQLIVEELRWMQRFEYAYHHSLAIALMVSCLALETAPDDSTVQQAGVSALTHDIGITRVPRAVLQKPSRLEAHEFALIREHPVYSYLLLAYYFGDPAAQAAQAAYAHHENLRGTGYPRGIRQADITAQWIRVCDVFDALISARPFRPAMDFENAIAALALQVEKGESSAEVFLRFCSFVSTPAAEATSRGAAQIPLQTA